MSKRQGFWTRSLQRSHSANHTRPWKCEVAGCEYSETGFLSQRMQRDHLDRFHTEGQSDSPISYLGATGSNDKAEIRSILFDLVRADRGTEIRSLLGHYKALRIYDQMQLLKSAARSSSTSTMSILFNDWDGKNTENALGVLAWAIQSKNHEVVKWLLRNTDTRLKGKATYPSFREGSENEYMLNRNAIDPWSKILASVLESDCETIFEILLPELVDEFLTERTKAKRDPSARSMTLEVIRATSCQPEREEKLLKLWGLITRPRKSELNLGVALGYVAESCCSLPLAKALLSYGAPINYTNTGDTWGNYRTSLHRALRRSRPETAELAKFLLYRGANPDVSALKSSVQRIEDEIGAREISKWLGMTWDELVTKVKADREAGICPPEYL